MESHRCYNYVYKILVSVLSICTFIWGRWVGGSLFVVQNKKNTNKKACESAQELIYFMSKASHDYDNILFRQWCKLLLQDMLTHLIIELHSHYNMR
jgi:hypothetical protein